MAHSPEGFGSSSDEDKPGSKKTSKKNTAEASGDGSDRSTRVVRFRFDNLGNRDAKQHHELPRTGRSLLTGAVLGEIKSEKGDDAKTKPEAGDEATETVHSKPDEQTEHTGTGATPENETAQTPNESSEKASAEGEDGERAEDSIDEAEDIPGWAAGPGPVVEVLLGEHTISGDIFERAKNNQEQPTEEAATEQSPVEASAAEVQESAPVASGWHEQPMQQHQARSYEVPPAGVEPPVNPPTGVSGGSGETPPPPPGSPEGVDFGEPSDPERPEGMPAAEQFRQPEPAEIFREYARRDAESAMQAHAVSPTEQVVTRRQADEQAYYAERSGQNRGLVTGLLVGGAYEHLKHKRREKKAAKVHDEHIRKLEKAQEAQTWTAKEQVQKQSETNRRLQSTEARLAAAEKRPPFQPLAPLEAARVAEQQTMERLKPQRPAEMQQFHAAEQPDEQLAIPPDHRIESSAWHHIEVDARTGRPVETPAFTYGEEYYRERAHESTPLAQRDAAAGEVALVAAAGGARRANNDANGVSGGGAQSEDDAMLPPANIPSATTQGPPGSGSQTSPQPFSATVPSRSSHTATPLWPYLVTLVAILICLAILLH